MGEHDAAPSLEATGERLVPSAYAGELVLAEHLARYQLAARLARGRRVLDVACGEGYGTAMLAAAGALSVVGIDLDPETAAHARRRHGVDARVGDAADLPFSAGQIDVIVSFETIEHVADPEAVIEEFARVLGDAGVLIMSTPNAREYKVDNPFHVREFTPEEFYDALRARFPAVRPIYQQNFLTSAVVDAGRLSHADFEERLEIDVHKVVGTEPGRELYCLALCGTAELPALNPNIAVLAEVFEAHELASRVQAAVTTQEALDARAKQAERNVEEWQALQQEWQARACEAERQNEELRTTLDRIANSASWRLTKPLRKVRGRAS
jgi:SAM-dependent methyltransferase